VQPLDPTDDDLADDDLADDPTPPGRHRLAPSPARAIALRVGLVAGCLLGTAALGLTTAGALGLTGLAASAPGHAATPGTSTVLPVDPAFERTVDIRVPAPRPQTPAPSAPAPAAAPVENPPPAPEVAPAPEPPPAPAPPPADTMRPGDRCPERGATAEAAGGERLVCRGGKERTRWRRA
jgi:hypothetical protein